MTGLEKSDYMNTTKETAEWLEKKGITGTFTKKELTDIGDLGLDFKKEGDITPEEADTKISGRFDAEVQKAGLNSYDIPELAAMKKQFDATIQETPDMAEKLKLYSAFMEDLKGEVGTTVAEENQRAKWNAKNMDEDAKNNQENTRTHSEKIRKIAQDLKEMADEAAKEKLHKEQEQQQQARSWWNLEAQISQESAENLTYPA